MERVQKGVMSKDLQASILLITLVPANHVGFIETLFLLRFKPVRAEIVCLIHHCNLGFYTVINKVLEQMSDLNTCGDKPLIYKCSSL